MVPFQLEEKKLKKILILIFSSIFEIFFCMCVYIYEFFSEHIGNFIYKLKRFYLKPLKFCFIEAKQNLKTMCIQGAIKEFKIIILMSINQLVT